MHRQIRVPLFSPERTAPSGRLERIHSEDSGTANSTPTYTSRSVYVFPTDQFDLAAVVVQHGQAHVEDPVGFLPSPLHRAPGDTVHETVEFRPHDHRHRLVDAGTRGMQAQAHTRD